jgi:hypothetical protein
MLTLKHPNGTTEQLSVELTTDEVQMLESYGLEQEKLASSAALNRRPYPMEIRADPERGSIVHAPLPSDEELIVLLHRLRPFILNDEPASYNKVSGLLGRSFISQPIRKLLAEERRRYDGRGWQKQLKISSGNTVVNSDEILMKWLNAYEYHRDPEKRADMSSLLATSLPGLVEWAVARMLFDKAKAIENVGVLARVLLGTRSGFRFVIDLNEYVLETY